MTAIQKLFLSAAAALAVCSAQAQSPAKLPPFTAADSAVTVISTRYVPQSFLRRFFMGNNYRREWAAPVTLPVLRLSQTPLKVKELGGGMQTRSLRLTGPDGREWALRSVDKYPAAALPPFARKTIARRVTEDFISAAFPYGSVLAGELAVAAAVIAPRPRMYLVADDPAFGEYNSLFAATVCTLEEYEPGFAKTENSREVLADVQKAPQYRVDQKALLKARLLDMLMSDWDRHSDNWRWGEKDSAGIRLYHGIPRDRDWAFYRSRGLLTRLARLGGFGFLAGFKTHTGNVKDISYKAWRFDRTFLNELNRADWEGIVTGQQAEITDAEIDVLVQTLPPPVYAAQGVRFAEALKKRRSNLLLDVMHYYDFLATEVTVNGTGGDEVFAVSRSDGGLKLTVQTKPSTAAPSRLLYERIFVDGETVFLKLNGFAGADDFLVEEAVASRIKLTIAGGEGADAYNIKGKVRTTVADSRSDNNVVAPGGKARLRFK